MILDQLLNLGAAEIKEKMKVVNDAWQNALTGLGDFTRDKRTKARAVSEPLDYEELTELYRGIDMAAKIVNLPAEEMTREWLDVVIPEKEDEAESVGEEFERLEAKDRFAEALKWKRLYGGGALFVGVNDGQLPEAPINEKNIKSIDFLSAFDSSECRPIEWQSNPALPRYGQPEFFQIYPRVFGNASATVLSRVHHSRVIMFQGIQANRWHSRVNMGWGDSVLDSIWPVIRDFCTAHDGTSVLMGDMSQAVFKIKGLASAMSADKGGLIKARMEMINYARSVLRAVMIDAEGEDFQRHQTPMAGVADVLSAFALRLSAASDIPVSLLMGESPAGLMATGDANVRFFYDSIKAMQGKQVVPGARELARLIMLSKSGPTRGQLPDQFSIVPRPLWQLSEKEQAETRKIMADTDAVYFDRGVLSGEEIRTNRFSGDKYSIETKVEEVDDTEDLTAEVPRIDPETGEAVELKAGQVEGQKPIATGAPAPKAAHGGALPGGESMSPGITPQDTAFTGIQVTSGIGIVEKVANEVIPRDSGIAALEFFFNMTTAQAEKLMGTAGNGFKPKEDPLVTAKAEALANPPAAAPGAPGGKPAVKKAPAPK